MPLDERVAIVAGASRGIGADIALALGSAGCQGAFSAPRLLHSSRPPLGAWRRSSPERGARNLLAKHEMYGWTGTCSEYDTSF